MPTRPRFPSLAAFERRPGDLHARGELSHEAGIRNPSRYLQTFLWRAEIAVGASYNIVEKGVEAPPGFVSAKRFDSARLRISAEQKVWST